MTSNAMTATEKQYISCLNLFAQWGGQLPASKAQIIVFFKEVGSIDRVERKKVSSLRVYRAALSDWHDRHWDEDPASHKDVKRCLSDLAKQERAHKIFQSKSRDLTVEEGARFITLLTAKDSTHVAIRNRALGGVAYVTGYRAGMLGDLKYEWLRNVNVEGSDIIIDRDPFKTGRRVRSVIPFTGEDFCPATWLREHLTRNHITGGFIFRSMSALGKVSLSDAPFHRNSVNALLKSLLKEAGIEGGVLTAHTFRKTMATLGVMGNVSSVEIAAQGGWSDVSTINNHYVNDAISMLGRAPQALVETTKAATKRVALTERKSKNIKGSD
jgi:integrase